jgi:hypothetical protein
LPEPVGARAQRAYHAIYVVVVVVLGGGHDLELGMAMGTRYPRTRRVKTH